MYESSAAKNNIEEISNNNIIIHNVEVLDLTSLSQTDLENMEMFDKNSQVVTSEH